MRGVDSEWVLECGALLQRRVLYDVPLAKAAEHVEQAAREWADDTGEDVRVELVAAGPVRPSEPAPERATLAAVRELCETWEKAYPEDIFSPPPEYPQKGARLVWVDPESGERLSEPFYLDQASAAMGRFMADVLRRTLDGEEGYGPPDGATEDDVCAVDLLGEILEASVRGMETGQPVTLATGHEWALRHAMERLRVGDDDERGGERG